MFFVFAVCNDELLKIKFCFRKWKVYVKNLKKKKKENKTLITYKEEDNSNANNNNNTTKANNTNTNHVNEQMESENAIVQSSSTSTVNRVPFKHETKAQVVKHFIGNKFSQIKKIFKK